MKKISLSTKVLIGIITGILLGILFGEDVAWMSILGDVFIGLLQMTVLPYIMFSLIVNIGRLSLDTGRKLIKYGLLFLTLLLGIGLVFLFVLPFAFPEWGSGSFYSSDFVQADVQFDFVKLYIPANPFESLSNNIVPAVVLFSIFIGLGVMKLPNKETLLKPLDVIISALNHVNKMVVKITPFGVFSIGAGVVSKLSWSELSRLQGYLLIYILVVSIVALVVLPYIISIFTPYSPKNIFKITRLTLITIFATGNIIVVFPQLIEDVKKILKTEKVTTSEATSEVDIIMPLVYPFPNLGTFLIFIFVPFAAWYSGKELLLTEYPIFLSSTLLSSFVTPITGLPFSLNLLDIPKETFQLFVVSTVITDRIRVVLGALHLITLTLLTVSASQGFLKLKKRKLVRAIIVITISGTLSIIGLNILLKQSIKNIPTNEEIMNRFTLISPQQPFNILDKAKRNPSRKWRGENTLSRIKKRGKLRVGFYTNSMPFAFYNKDSLLVGFDIDLAHQLAFDLGVTLEFSPINNGFLIDEINNNYYDIVMSGIFISSNYAQQMELSKPYLNVSLALVVKKENNNFNNFETALQLDTFTIAYFERFEIAKEFASNFSHAGIYAISDINDFFSFTAEDSIQPDAYLTSAERAGPLTILHPDYKMVNPLPYHINNALVFPLAKDEVWIKYIDKWIDFRTKDGTFQNVYNQWILGREFKKKQKAWSVYNNIIKPALFSKSDTSAVKTQ
jgi:Na+/H+-dicarboxylate symporter/ABC-type amino acid transport substrate-binding protein